jgi:hypothetical protein
MMRGLLAGISQHLYGPADGPRGQGHRLRASGQAAESRTHRIGLFCLMTVYVGSHFGSHQRRPGTRLGAHLDGHDRTLSPGNAPAIASTMSGKFGRPPGRRRRLPQHRSRLRYQHPASEPPPTDDHEALNDFAGALPDPPPYQVPGGIQALAEKMESGIVMATVQTPESTTSMIRRSPARLQRI